MVGLCTKRRPWSSLLITANLVAPCFCFDRESCSNLFLSHFKTILTGSSFWVLGLRPSFCPHPKFYCDLCSTSNDPLYRTRLCSSSFYFYFYVYWSKTMKFLSLGNKTLFLCERFIFVSDPQHGRGANRQCTFTFLCSRLCKLMIINITYMKYYHVMFFTLFVLRYLFPRLIIIYISKKFRNQNVLQQKYKNVPW